MSSIVHKDGVGSHPVIYFGEGAERFGPEVSQVIIEFQPTNPKVYARVLDAAGGGWVNYMSAPYDLAVKR